MQQHSAVIQGVTVTQPFEIGQRNFTALVLRPTALPDEAFFAALDEELAAYSAYFDNAPVVLDLDRLGEQLDAAALRKLLDQLKRRPMSLMGLRNGNRAQIAVAKAAGLIGMRSSSETKEAEREVPTARAPQPAPTATAAAPKPTASKGALVVTEPVRSGQKVFAEHGDLVIVAPVSAGAELVSVGNIHVYGTLRGRALAGVSGDETARIFCQSFNAELVAVGGLYKTSEQFDAAVLRQPVQIYLQGETLEICALT